MHQGLSGQMDLGPNPGEATYCLKVVLGGQVFGGGRDNNLERVSVS